MNIGTDLDGVLIEVMTILTCAIRNRLGIEPDWADYNANLPRDMIAQIHDQMVAEGDLSRCGVYEDNLEALRKLALTNNIFYITARSSMTNSKIIQTIIRGTTRKFMRFNNFPDGKIIYTSNKVEACIKHDVPIMFEDHLPTAQKFLGTPTTCYLIDRKWNQYTTYPHRISSIEVINLEKT